VNDEPMTELQILDRDGKKALGIRSQLNDDELRWVCAELHRALWPSEQKTS